MAAEGGFLDGITNIAQTALETTGTIGKDAVKTVGNSAEGITSDIPIVGGFVKGAANAVNTIASKGIELVSNVGETATNITSRVFNPTI